MFKITFCGGAQEVTGANYLIETEKARILVDCGMFQCPRFCAARNVDEFPYDPSTIDALFVTHAHIDHTGRIPKLFKYGFRGKIFSTIPTKDFGKLMLEDSLGVLEKEASRNGEEAFYAMEDVEGALKLWEGVPYHQRFTVGDVAVTLYEAGHILGSAMMLFEIGDKKVLFTGDLGNTPMPLLNPPESIVGVNIMIIESAYGDRVHEDTGERKVKLERAIEDVAKRGGTLMIPAFALERTQELLYEFNELMEHGRVPRIPVYLDSPLSIRATDVYRKHMSYFSPDAKAIIKGGDDLFDFPGLHRTLTSDESRAINNVRGPKVILAGAGMMTGGRILHHARRYLHDKNSIILFIGYQGAGSIGRRIMDGEHQVNIMGDKVFVNAEVRSIHGYSAHADTNMLLEFVQQSVDTLEKVFVVQGEPSAALFLSQRIRDYLGIPASAPRLGETHKF
ncbi:MAG: MBL fold metallo-hydrolase [Patescibacteria group bacterium]